MDGTLSLVRRLAREFLRPHTGRLAAALGCMGLVAASTAGNAWLMEPVLDRIFVDREGHLLWAIAGAVLALAVLKGFATYGQSVLMNDVGQRVVAEIQRSLFARLMRADLAFFHANPTGTLVSRFIS